MISGYAFTDPQTIEAIQRIYNQYQYLLDLTALLVYWPLNRI